jgi:hypothetical protein
MAITYIRTGGSTGTSVTLDVGVAGNDRCLVVILDDESTPGGTFQGTVTCSTATAHQVQVADNATGAGNHCEMHIFYESDLGSVNGSQSISFSGGNTGWGIFAALFYGVKDYDGAPYDVQIDNTSAAQNEILPAVVDIPVNGLLVFTANNGQSGTYNNADWDTNPTETTDDGQSPEIEMTEILDAVYGASTVNALAYWISTTSAMTNRQFRARGSVANNRGTGIIASFEEATTNPVVTSVGDEDLEDNETNVIIDGSVFGASQGSGYVELGNNSVYASCTIKSTQSVDTWSDTQIQIDIVRGSLSYGQVWCFVTENGGSRNDPGFSVNLYEDFTVTGIDPTTVRIGDTGVDAEGTDFGSTGPGADEGVYLTNDSSGASGMVAQTVTAWANTAITFTVVQGSLNLSNPVYLFVRRDKAASGDPESGYNYRQAGGVEVDVRVAIPFELTDSTWLTNKEVTTPQLTAPTGSFRAGQCLESSNPGDQISLLSNEYTEIEFCMQAKTESEAGAQYEFQITDNGSPIGIYSKTPKVTISP